MSPNISKPEKKQQRALQILRIAQRLAREQGYLTLNVAEVAKQAGISIGTLYSHFQNKEGLVAALAVHSLNGRVATFDAIRALKEFRPDEQLIIIVFADFLFSLDHPELFAAEQLGASTAILKEMPGGLFHWIAGKDRLRISPVQVTAEEAIQAGLISAWKNTKKQAVAIDRGIWMLVAGGSYTHNVLTLNESRQNEDFVFPIWLKQNISALLKGFGWSSKQPDKDVERLARFSLKSCRHLAEDCKI